MADGFNNLSPEQFKQLSRNLEDAKSLGDRELEIIEKALEGEKEIGELRISYLNRFLDAYSSSLDSIIAKKSSDLTDAFLIIEKTLAENVKNLNKATANFKKATKELKDATAAQASDTGASTDGASNSSESGGGTTGGGGNGGGSNSGGGDRLEDIPDLPSERTPPPNIASDEGRTTMDENASEGGKYFADQLSNFYKKTEEERLEAIRNNAGNMAAIEQRSKEEELKRLQAHEKKVESIRESMMQLETARYEEAQYNESQITEIRLANIKQTIDAELEAQTSFNEYANRIAAGGEYAEEIGEQRVRASNAESESKTLQQQEEKRLEYIRKQELAAKRKNNGILTKEEAARIQKDAAEKFKLDKKNLEKLTKEREKLEGAKARAGERQEMRSLMSEMRTAETWEERKEAFKQLTHNEAGEFDAGKAMSAAVLAISDFAKQLESQVDNIAGKQTLIDTRLQGSNNKTHFGSYWDQMTKDMMRVGAVNPFFKQETFAANIEDLVGRGIAFNIEQRAFLMTIKDKIATTFDVADAALLKLIRIQQEDSTAGRMGMESALNAFLNEMYETSEYLKGVAESVRSSLYEMEALMQGAEATEVEFQVQKWMGSLFSVGMSDTAVNSIAAAFGQIAAGQIEGISGGGTGNLLIMAANDAGLSIADMLTDGIDASDTNKLLRAVVNYLAELAESANGNQVVQQQLAGVFGVKASDLKAATNLVSKESVNNVYNMSMTYNNMLARLNEMASTMHERTSIAEMMDNVWKNGEYTLASSMASSPVSYMIYKVASLLDDAAGGIDLPFLNVMGFGVDLNTTVSDLMRLGAMSGGILGSLGPILEGLGNSFDGQGMLKTLGIGQGNKLDVTHRGSGSILKGNTGGGSSTTSGSGSVGNASGSDVKDSTIQESEDSKEQQMIEAKEEAEANQVDFLNQVVLKIYELLDDVASGKSSFKVQVEGYGLTKTSGSSKSALGGVSGMKALNETTAVTSSGGLTSSSGNNLSGGGTAGVSGLEGMTSGSISLGGWTTA